MTNILAPCSNFIKVCKPSTQEEHNLDSSFFNLDDEDGVIVIDLTDLMRAGFNPNKISFGTFQKTPHEQLIAPVLFNNPKYNVTLKISHASDLDNYKEFQNTLGIMSMVFDTDILAEVKTTKPAAIAVEADRMSALQLGDPMIAMMALESNDNTINLLSAVNFVSEKGNMLLPPCELKDAIRNGHLFNTNTGDLLTMKEFKTFNKSFAKDLDQEPAIPHGRFKLRSVR